MIHTAKKVSVSDTEQVRSGSKVILYTRVWDENDKKYYDYAFTMMLYLIKSETVIKYRDEIREI